MAWRRVCLAAVHNKEGVFREDVFVTDTVDILSLLTTYSLSSYCYHEYNGILTVFHGVWITLYHTVNSGARAPSGHKHHMHFFLDN